MLLRHCPDQVYYTALRAIAHQYSPYENMVSFESVFKFYDNYNVKFSNVLIESTAYDAS